MKHENDRKRTFLLITIPILALFICFNTIPLIRGAMYSFTNSRGFGSHDFVGFRNYMDLFTDARVGKSYLFTIKLALVTTVVVNVLSLILALGLNSKIRAKGFFRGAYFLPNILGSLVVGYIFNYFFTYILPALADMIGIESLRTSILSSPSKAWIGVMIVCAWQAIAMNTIIYISGLQTVPEDVYEAGGLDGATGWKQFRHLTFPLIIPFFSINMVLSVKNFLMVFDQIMALTKGGPAQSTESISYLIYNNGMAGGQFGFQSANAVVFFVMIVSKVLYNELPSLGTMILFCVLLAVFAIGAPGVPGGTVMASLGLIISVIGFGDDGTGLMLAIFAIQDSFGTACNVTGDGALTLMLTGYAKKHKIKKQNISIDL